MGHQPHKFSISDSGTAVNTTNRSVHSGYVLTLPSPTSASVASGPTAALIARYAAQPSSSAAAFAHDLIDAIEGDPIVLHDVLLAAADRRDPAVRKRRVQLFGLSTRLLARCYAELLGDAEGREILTCEERRQALGLTLASSARASAIERAIVRLSDVIVQTADPCFRSMKRRRRTGLCRRPDDGMPLFTPGRPPALDGAFFRDIDLREWTWLALSTIRLTDADGEAYDEVAPTPNDDGTITFGTFATWQGLSCADRYKQGERKVSRQGGRVVREDAPIVGLREDARGRLVVELNRFLLDRIARSTAAWSTAARETQRMRTAARNAPAAIDASSATVTRTEKLLLQLATEGADVQYLRTLWADQIEQERRLKIYA